MGIRAQLEGRNMARRGSDCQPKYGHVWTCQDLGLAPMSQLSVFFGGGQNCEKFNCDGETSVKLGIVDGAILGCQNLNSFASNPFTSVPCLAGPDLCLRSPLLAQMPNRRGPFCLCAICMAQQLRRALVAGKHRVFAGFLRFASVHISFFGNNRASIL